MIIVFSEFISYNKDAQSQIIPKSLSSASVHKIYRDCFITLFFSVALRPNAGHGLLIHEVPRSRTTTRHSR